MASGNRLALRTDIRPLSAGDVAGDVRRRVSRARAAASWRDVVFDHDVPTHCRIGERVQWSGVMSAHDRNDFSAIAVRLWKRSGTAADAIRMQVPVELAMPASSPTRSSSQNQAGTYMMEVFLFWPGSGTQTSRAALSPIVID